MPRDLDRLWAEFDALYWEAKAAGAPELKLWVIALEMKQAIGHDRDAAFYGEERAMENVCDAIDLACDQLRRLL